MGQGEQEVPVLRLCSMVFSTCSCFEIVDEAGPFGGSSRVRIWDACRQVDYGVVADGHDSCSDRMRQRNHHERTSFVSEFRMPSCVSYGHRAENCPARVTVVEVVEYPRGGA